MALVAPRPGLPWSRSSLFISKSEVTPVLLYSHLMTDALRSSRDGADGASCDCNQSAEESRSRLIFLSIDGFSSLLQRAF